MERLGQDEIFSIFERISKKEDKKSFALVCKIFLKVACSHLHSLHTESPNLLFDILTVSPKMLTFECHKALSNNHMKLIAESCPNIKHLRLHSFTKKHLDGKLEFDDVGLCAIATACIHLDFVDLSGRLCFTEIGIGALVRSCKNLRRLWLLHCANVTDKALKMLGETTRLEELDLYGCRLITDLGLEYLANGKSKHCLETLGLYKCDRITDYGVVALCELPNLKILYLDFLTNITDISLREIVSKCLKMSSLSLKGCEKITSVGLHAVSDLHRLRSLTLVSCYKLSWEGVKSTVLRCENMRFLYLSRSIKKPMPDPGFEDFYLVSGRKCYIIWV